MASSKSVKASKMEATTRSWTAKPILSLDFTEAPPLQEVYVGVLKERKDTSIAIQSISTVLPGFAHLKRCSNGKLLLAPLRSSELSEKGRDISLSEDELKNQLKEKGFNLSLLEDMFQVTKVPSKAPKTKSQASQASKIWPVNFHPEPMIERLIDGSEFDDDRLHAIERIMSLLIQAAKLEAVGDERCTGAAAVVDPEDGRILAISAARTDRHPMWHASMLAVDLVAKLHGGGAWQLIDEDFTKKEVDAVEKKETTSDKRTDPMNTADEEESLRKRLKKIKRRYEEETPLCYPKTLSALQFPCRVSLGTEIVRKGRGNSGVKIENPHRKEREDSNAEKCGPYLCTGYWVFLLMEPCPLCAMALLHSRVARIFYGAANPSAGVLGTRALLHTLPGLNHRYQVWSGILERECQRTLEEINKSLL
ncbi:probable inactive tRNA-specific adenosine deaminase-like protein 3 [Pseudomyrmex gracilis]|uniref:probable inactive tRNA-specific adenosine deaminase-like protein 3 n=1 Tax=Pseudomyrmex gracilis TaxID=219809 RepID=UPI0009959BDE|nr:probable inactive tRNA-specific adenosine deaminase-like protein 3 [Pseudomyrmex gracilis]